MRKFRIKIRGEEYVVEVEEITGNEARSEADDRPARSASNTTRKTSATADSSSNSNKTAVSSSSNSDSSSSATTETAGAVKAPMAGKVLEIKVEEGEEVEVGDLLLVLEAMKMENDITAPQPGRVQEIRVSNEDSVEADEVLLILQ